MFWKTFTQLKPEGRGLLRRQTWSICFGCAVDLSENKKKKKKKLRCTFMIPYVEACSTAWWPAGSSCICISDQYVASRISADRTRRSHGSLSFSPAATEWIVTHNNTSRSWQRMVSCEIAVSKIKWHRSLFFCVKIKKKWLYALSTDRFIQINVTNKKTYTW